MSLNEYKISCELKGHSLDVRAVTKAQDSIVSGSRDKTVKIWNEEGLVFFFLYIFSCFVKMVFFICFIF